MPVLVSCLLLSYETIKDLAEVITILIKEFYG